MLRCRGGFDLLQQSYTEYFRFMVDQRCPRMASQQAFRSLCYSSSGVDIISIHKIVLFEVSWSVGRYFGRLAKICGCVFVLQYQVVLSTGQVDIQHNKQRPCRFSNPRRDKSSEVTELRTRTETTSAVQQSVFFCRQYNPTSSIHLTI